ncbi:MAG: hypothetical protein ACI4JN_04915, partial [Ruminococcus sp.]
DDLYFNVSLNGETYTFTVESYLCDSTTEVYSAVKNLQIGDVIDMEGFLYWYEGVNPHITAVTAAEKEKNKYKKCPPTGGIFYIKFYLDNVRH